MCVTHMYTAAQVAQITGDYSMEQTMAQITGDYTIWVALAIEQ